MNKETVSTKTRLLETASRIFSEHGYAGTSIRMIAGELGVSVSAVSFHYGSKEILYKAVLERAAAISEEFYGPLPSLVRSAYEQNELDQDSAREYLKRFVELFLDWALGAGPVDVVKIIIWEHTVPTQYNNIIYEKLKTCFLDVIEILLKVITGIKDEYMIKLLTHTIAGEIIYFYEDRMVVEYNLIDNYTTNKDKAKDLLLRKIMIEVEHYSELEN